MAMVIWGQGQITLRQHLNSLAAPQYQGPGAEESNSRMDISPWDNTSSNPYSDN